MADKNSYVHCIAKVQKVKERIAYIGLATVGQTLIHEWFIMLITDYKYSQILILASCLFVYICQLFV